MVICHLDSFVTPFSSPTRLSFVISLICHPTNLLHLSFPSVIPVGRRTAVHPKETGGENVLLEWECAREIPCVCMLYCWSGPTGPNRVQQGLWFHVPSLCHRPAWLVMPFLYGTVMKMRSLYLFFPPNLESGRNESCSGTSPYRINLYMVKLVNKADAIVLGRAMKNFMSNRSNSYSKHAKV